MVFFYQNIFATLIRGNLNCAKSTAGFLYSLSKLCLFWVAIGVSVKQGFAVKEQVCSVGLWKKKSTYSCDELRPVWLQETTHRSTFFCCLGTMCFNQLFGFNPSRNGETCSLAKWILLMIFFFLSKEKCFLTFLRHHSNGFGVMVIIVLTL